MEYITDHNRHKKEILVEQALMFKFPEMTGLEVSTRDDGHLIIKFNKDGIHTSEMVSKFLAEFRAASLSQDDIS